MMGDLISPIHIILLLIVALLVFGPKKLPEIGAGLGRSIREFKKSMNAVVDSHDDDPIEYTTQVVPKDKTPEL